MENSDRVGANNTGKRHPWCCKSAGAIHHVLGLTLFPLLLFCIAGCSRSPDLVWKFQTGAAVYPSPAISGGNVVIGSNDHHLYALDRKNGAVNWKTNLGDRILMPAFVEQNNIYIGTASGYYYQIRAQDGSIGWKFNAKGMLEFDACADADGIYLGSYDKNFYKIDRQGNLLWAYEANMRLSSSCLFYKDLVLTTSWDTYIYALNRRSGELVWKFQTEKMNYGNGVLAGDSFYFSTHNAFYCLDPATGNLRFQQKTPYNTYILAQNNFLFTQENGLTKRSLDGTILKNLQFSPFHEFPPSIAGNTIVLSDTANQIRGISFDLEPQWKYGGKGIFWSPGVFYEGVYYIGNRDSHVYALKLPS